MELEVKEKHEVEIGNMSVNDVRKRCFVKRSQALFGSKYTFVDNLPEQIEALEGFKNWESFSETWDVYWVGLDPRTMSWVAGRHNSPIRKIVTPLRIVLKDERNGRLQETHKDRADVQKFPVPEGRIQESEQDRVISESLSGKVIVDEPDTDKAIRLIESNMEMLMGQLKLLKGK